MIIAHFGKNNFSISGHSGYAESGSDIVCAAVSAMTMLVCNTITHQFGDEATINVDEAQNEVSLRLINDSEKSRKLIKGFQNEIIQLQNEYPEFIKIN